MGGFGLTGHQNGLPQHLNNGIFPSGLNEFFGAVPAVGVASNTVDSLIAAVEGWRCKQCQKFQLLIRRI